MAMPKRSMRFGLGTTERQQMLWPRYIWFTGQVL
jgi:hypothetical protein